MESEQRNVRYVVSGGRYRDIGGTIVRTSRTLAIRGVERVAKPATGADRNPCHAADIQDEPLGIGHLLTEVADALGKRFGPASSVGQIMDEIVSAFIYRRNPVVLCVACGETGEHGGCVRSNDRRY
ncbi:uncharacterized protein GLRG_11652 [Colletotrichum graminicola M1.001]|uniref:Uncharacterized protein n=1 Tax=Colletotrichum graminicola (strain M1.001 / M2 / FGSC 10212) TaxID=645133 RepID=E3R069_COLGM|nr:uncharacterized protein GLRG_11652 [Colletotrichum graminicola M1.001]EFQ36507.1 hypothetical protein GLRG_11652 [Colletotrichum graminicola M1.001]